MKTTEFSIFSDGNLSWNKNETIKQITTAFDKSVKTMFLGLGYGVTFVRNKIMMSDRKMRFTSQDNKNDKKNPNKALARNYAWEQNRLEQLQGRDTRAIDDTIKNANKKISDNTPILDDLKVHHGIDADTKDAKEKDAATMKAGLDAKKGELDNKKATMDSY